MADTDEAKGNPTPKDSQAEGDQVDLTKEFTDENMRMAAAESAMTRKIKRLETVLTDFKELDALDTTNIENLHEIASEVDEIKMVLKKLTRK